MAKGVIVEVMEMIGARIPRSLRKEINDLPKWYLKIVFFQKIKDSNLDDSKMIYKEEWKGIYRQRATSRCERMLNFLSGSLGHNESWYDAFVLHITDLVIMVPWFFKPKTTSFVMRLVDSQSQYQKGINYIKRELMTRDQEGLGICLKLNL